MKYYKVDAAGNQVPADGTGQLSRVEVVAAAKTLVVADSGKTFVLSAAAGAAVTLPALVAGFKAKFIVGAAFATTDWTVVCPSAIGQGGATVAGALVAAANETTITFANAAETVGDFVDVECDGTNYYINGYATAVGGITFA